MILGAQVHRMRNFIRLCCTYSNSFFPSGIRLWNQLPEDLVTAPSLVAFKEGLQRQIKSSQIYFESVHIQTLITQASRSFFNRLTNIHYITETYNHMKKAKIYIYIPYDTVCHHFNPNNPEIFPEIQQNKSILLRDERLKTIYNNKTFLKSKRQPPNLKKLLTKARFSNTWKQNFQVTKCKEPICGLCKHIKEGSTFSFKDKNFTVNADMTCTVKNVIYVIES